MTAIRSCLVVAALGAVILLPGCAPPATPAPSPLAELGPGWNPIEPGGDTMCSDGSAYRFFVRAADETKLMVYFQGGGACWTGETCDAGGEPTYKLTADLELHSAAGDQPEKGEMHGIFADGRADNPFADYSVVFVPYCTGDVHIGDRVATYTVAAHTVAAKDDVPERQVPEHQVTVHHNGWVNSQAALDWTYEHFAVPGTIFVTGSSAGAIPSPLYARVLADHYPQARLVQLGDGAGGYRNMGQVQPYVEWDTLGALASFPEYSGMAPEAFSFESLYISSGKAHPEATFARYDTAADEVQVSFIELGGVVTGPLQTMLAENEADIDAGISNYHSYVAPGTVHTILLRPEFYTYEVGGTKIRDWVAALAVGDPVSDVHCGDCEQAPAPVPEATGTPATGGAH